MPYGHGPAPKLSGATRHGPMFRIIDKLSHLEASILGKPEAFPHGCHRVAPVGVPCNVLIDTLQPDLQPGAPIR